MPNRFGCWSNIGQCHIWLSEVIVLFLLMVKHMPHIMKVKKDTVTVSPLPRRPRTWPPVSSALQREVVSHDSGGEGRQLQDRREHCFRPAGVRRLWKSSAMLRHSSQYNIKTAAVLCIRIKTLYLLTKRYKVYLTRVSLTPFKRLK